MSSASSSSNFTSPLGTSLLLPCGVTLPNRMVKSAMTETLADPATNLPNEQHFALYARWAQGGVGTQISGNVMVDRRRMEAPGNVALEARDEKYIELYRQYAQAIQSQPGSIAIMQLSHSGRQTPMSVGRGLAPSVVPLKLPGMPSFLTPVLSPREATLDDIAEIIERFGTAARLACQKAGWDGVQVHSAHGYLLSSFLSPRLNQRTDQYGGSAENRYRLLYEVVARVRQEIGPKKILCVKLNSADFARGGFTEDESVSVISHLTNVLTVDFIEVSGGTYENAVMMKSKEAKERDQKEDDEVKGSSSSSSSTTASSSQPQRESTRNREAYFLTFCHRVRREVPNAILLCTGGFRSGIAMNRVIQAKEVDLVGLARPLCVLPDFPRLLLESSQLQLKQLDSAVSDAITVPTYSVGIQTPFEGVNKTIEAAMENLFHQQSMRRLANGEEPRIVEDLSFMSKMYYLNVVFVRGYIYEPRKHPKRAVAYLTIALAAGAALLAVRYGGGAGNSGNIQAALQDPKQVAQKVAGAVKGLFAQARGALQF